MEDSVLITLEFAKVRDLLVSHTSSLLGKQLASTLQPVNQPEVVAEQLQETDEAVQLLIAEAAIPLAGIHDISAELQRAQIGGILEPAELKLIGTVLYAARRLRTFFAGLQRSYPLLQEIAAQLTIVRTLESEIDNTIGPAGEICDNATPELARLRRELQVGQQRIRDKLDSILRSNNYQKFFQEALITIRSDRYVIPVKQEYRQQFPGIIHDQSASGATVFIEPLAVVNLANALKQLQAAERVEIERILQQLSAQVATVVNELSINAIALAKLDFIVAKGRLALALKAHRPQINTQGWLNLRQARHPLISADTVVPIDIHLGEHFSTLLITGPNTGGKTVALKTVGLFALMNQAGLFVPAAEGATLPIFRAIYADIGDEQSIEHSLSTFSSHMTKLVHVIDQAQPGDLVLLDEIGIGTDPDEGAALSMAMLEYLHGLGTYTIATTHFSELKHFAYTRAGIENASVEFDTETLRPTYRLLIGVPGSSNAFQISRRLGLSEQIIDRAQTLMVKEQAEFEQVLQQLEAEKRHYHEYNERLQVLAQQAEESSQQQQQQQAAWTEHKAELLNKAKLEAAAIIRTARQEADAVISDLKQHQRNMALDQQQSTIDQAKQRLKQAAAGLTLEDTKSALPAADSASLLPGSTVWVTSLQQQGTVLTLNGEHLTVQLGALKMSVSAADCRLLERAAPIAPVQRQRHSKVNLATVQTAARQIDIRGVNVEDGAAMLDKFLDDAVMSGLSTVLVIHGKGTGALRKGIRAYLRTHHHVKAIQIAEVNEGGDGATAVTLN